MSAAALYRELILEHNRAPRRFGDLQDCTHAADGANASCGDHLRCELIVHDGRVRDYRFRGECCAIATAAASMLGERLVAFDARQIEALRSAFVNRMRSDMPDADDPALGELNALGELRRFPARQRCAMLPFATVLAALRGESSASTE